ncbi:cupin domain-containing protein [Mesorhizobium sp. M0276]|uniref:cupin domain-containing protein n=1 Tax=Mesorhizobium sp. M0276 TaxID=2956928 RepID=UPI00333D0CD7
MSRPIRFSSTGRLGWQQLPDHPLDHAELIEGLPVGLDHAYYARPERGVKSGIWRCGPYTEHYDSYTADEFMVILEGEVTLEADGFSETYGKGDSFLVPKGFHGTWRQPVPMLKFYVIVE